MNGLGSLFHSLIQLRMPASSSVTLRWVDLRSLRRVSSANQRSTRFIQLELAEVPALPVVLGDDRSAGAIWAGDPNGAFFVNATTMRPLMR